MIWAETIKELYYIGLKRKSRFLGSEINSNKIVISIYSSIVYLLLLITIASVLVPLIIIDTGIFRLPYKVIIIKFFLVLRIISLDFIISTPINIFAERLLTIYSSLVINITPSLLRIYIDTTVYSSASYLLEPRPRIFIIINILRISIFKPSSISFFKNTRSIRFIIYPVSK